MTPSKGMENKYIKKWPEDTINSRFTFGNQVYDNIFWCSVSGVGLWTAYEVFFLYLWAAGYSFFPFYFNLMDYPIYSLAMMIFVPLWRHFHFCESPQQQQTTTTTTNLLTLSLLYRLGTQADPLEAVV